MLAAKKGFQGFWRQAACLEGVAEITWLQQSSRDRGETGCPFLEARDQKPPSSTPNSPAFP